MTEATAWGTLYGLGVGPGDPELLTVRAHRLLTTVPVVFAPAGRGNEPGYAQRIVAAYLDPSRQRLEPLTFALSRDVTAMERAWFNAAQRVAEVSAAGLDAAFITEGDPLTYSTFVHLYRTLQRQHPRVPVQVVPGITSFAAASAAALHPLVDQDERLAVIPASYAPADLERVLQAFDTVVLLKVSAVIDQVLDLLERLNLVDHALYVRRVGRPEQEVRHDLRALRGQALDYLSLVIVYPSAGALNV